MRNIFAVIRANAWWEYKIPPMLAVVYMVMIQSQIPFFKVLQLMSIPAIAVVLGAIYVSLLNDATDVSEDLKAGKKNGMIGYTAIQRIGIVSFPVILGFCIVAMSGSLFSWQNLFYLAAHISFTLYSLPPFRLKKRGVAGLIAEALGSEMLPVLFLVSCFYRDAKLEIQPLLFVFLGTWFFCFGLRGILWHQLDDSENDKVSGLQTVVQQISKPRLSRIGICIVTIEVAAFLAYVICNQLFLVIPGLIFYLIYIQLLAKKNGVEQTIIRPRIKPYRIFLFDYYRIFFPLFLLVAGMLNGLVNVFGLLFHLFLFQSTITSIFKEVRQLWRAVLSDILLQVKDR
ncbi:hypothetical protein QTN47_10090 [Danxiaibacter flavus]|uniref:Prenyltransferase n=1 Tax=Danxiaibacter flavus TaxID=3049108 RepID=A0ABV3ZE32_9BACT|nr:hypothetical protein QNM32_10090 [Chitinophagaceae bacterium DXS]